MNIDNLNITQAVCNNLTALIKSDKLPHAIMLCSGSKEQRENLSLYIAAAKICTGKNKPCGLCMNCKKVYDGNHPDVITIAGETSTASFKIEQIRKIKKEAYIIANEASGKVYILSDVQNMTVQAQNALLKILEEPPENVSFILCCDSLSLILDTIISRVTVFNIIGADESDDKEETQAKEIAEKLAVSLLEPNEYEFLKLTAVFEKNKSLLSLCFKYIQQIFRNAVIIKSTDNSIDSGSKASYSLAERLTTLQLVKLIEQIDTLNNSLNSNANLNLLLTLFCSTLRRITRE